MVPISRKAIYALQALMVLTFERPRWPLALREIAERGAIPLKFLEQIMMALRTANLVESQKGPRGGYALARSAEAITLSSILDAVDGRRLAGRVHADRENGISEDSRAQAIGRILREANESAAKVLESKSLADLCEDSRTILAERRAVMYHI